MERQEETQKSNKKGSSKLRIMFNSAWFALLLSIIFFIHQEISSRGDFIELVNNLVKIESSLSTRYLGIFPEYISDIDLLMEKVITDQNEKANKDSLVIFQDVLYYGLKSDPDGFRRLLKDLLVIAENGSHITIAFSDYNGFVFEREIRDELISVKYQDLYRKECAKYREVMKNFRLDAVNVRKTCTDAEVPTKMRELVNQHYKPFISQYTSDEKQQRKMLDSFNSFPLIKPYILQSFFDSTKVAQSEDLVVLLAEGLKPLELYDEESDIDRRLNNLFLQIENIRNKYLRKSLAEMQYSDYESAYKEISKEIFTMLSENKNIELLPIKEELMMCCWMRSYKGKGMAIIAFPSKYSSAEIGFISQDKEFIRYINSMLRGAKRNINGGDM